MASAVRGVHGSRVSPPGEIEQHFPYIGEQLVRAGLTESELQHTPWAQLSVGYTLMNRWPEGRGRSS